MLSGGIALFMYDGTNYQLLNSQAQSATLPTLTNSLSGDVALNNTGTYFDGPSVAQGSTVKLWLAMGGVQLTDTAGAANFNVKLWDGTTIIDSKRTQVSGASQNTTVSLSGRIQTPAGNIRISVNDVTSTSGKIQFNASGNSKDSTITVIQIG
jgi:hypothetical protein